MKNTLLLPMMLAAVGTAAQVTNVSPNKISVNVNGSTLTIPYYRNLPLSTTDPVITRAIVIVHGTNRNADDYYSTIVDAVAQRAGASDSTIIIAPQFLTEDDINAHALDAQHLYWSDGGWKSGSLSRDETTNPRPERISSYAVTDTILLRLAANLPSLRTVVVAGHSAGGQFVNRYTVSSPAVTALCSSYGISVRSIVANPSSYLYLNGERRKTGTIDQFEVPSTSCTAYDDYKYGLNALYSYLAASGAAQIRTWYAERDVIYLLGGDDDNPSSSSLDVSCEAMLQGDHRLERGTVFYHYLQYYYGAAITLTHRIDTVPGVAHDNYGMFTSAEGVAWLLDHAVGCSTTAAEEEEGQGSGWVVYPNPTYGSWKLEVESWKLHPLQLPTYNLQLFSSDGMRVMSRQVAAHSYIDMRHLPSGIYLLHLSDGHASYTTRVVKQ